MIRKITICVILFVASFAFADNINNKEGKSHNLYPSFKDIDYEISISSEYTDYANEQALSIAKGREDKYSADEPSFFYGSKPTAAIASIFVGDKAYRNFILKAFFEKDYKSVIDSYEEYVNKLSQKKDKEEISFLYAMGLWEKKDPKAEEALFNACINSEEFSGIACDKYSQIMWEKGRYSDILNMGDSMKAPFSAYTFSAYALSCFKLGEYQKAYTMMQNNPAVLYHNSDFNDLRAVAEYYKGNYETVIKLTPFTSDKITFIISDSLINLNKINEAENLLNKISVYEQKNYLAIKLLIAKGDLTDASNELDRIVKEEHLLDILNYYVSKEFPDLNLQFMKSFNFEDKKHENHLIYYKGMYYFEQKNYKRAAEQLAKVDYPQDIAELATFYRGIALVHIGSEKAEHDIASVLNTSSDPTKIADARFMLAQSYYLKKGYNEAMQLLDGCDEMNCKELQAEVCIARGNYDDAIELVDELNTPKSNLIRAAAYINLGEYNLAREELSSINTNTRDALHLQMLIYFRENNSKKGIEVLNNHKEYDPILFDGVKELILLGDYKQGSKLLHDGRTLTPEMKIISAELYSHEGKAKEAKAIYNSLIKEDILLYEAYKGLVNADKSSKEQAVQLANAVKDIKARGDFPEREILLVELAKKAAELKENVQMIQIINLFFANYEDSPYAGDIYAERARLFYTTGRAKECVQDVNTAIENNSKLENQLIFLKARCMEDYDEKNALLLYKNMIDNNKQYKVAAAERLVMLSNNADEIFSTAEKIKGDNWQLYLDTFRKYVQVASIKDLKKNKAFLEKNASGKNNVLKCVNYYAEARILNSEGKSKSAAETYHKLYLTYQGDKLTKPALKEAAAIYTKLKMTDNATQMNNLLKKLK